MKTVTKLIKCFLIVFAFGLSEASHAQNYLETVTLKSGGEVKGVIVEQVPGSFIKVLSEDKSDTVKIMMENIVRITKTFPGPNDSVKPITEDSTDLPVFNQRPFHVVLNGATGGGDFAAVGFGSSILYTVGKRIQTGVGINYFSDYSGNQSNSVQQILPVSAEFLYLLEENRTGRLALLAHAGMGYNFVLNDSYDDPVVGTIKWSDGLYLRPGLTFRANITKDFGLMFGMAYQYFNAKKTQISNQSIVSWHSSSNLIFTGSIFF